MNREECDAKLCNCQLFCLNDSIYKAFSIDATADDTNYNHNKFETALTLLPSYATPHAAGVLPPSTICQS